MSVLVGTIIQSIRWEAIILHKTNANTDITANDLLTGLIKDIFGSLFIGINKFPEIVSTSKIGRTYFSDRLKLPYPIEHNTVDRIMILYKSVFNMESQFDRELISSKVVDFLMSTYDIDVAFLIPYYNDPAPIAEYKYKSILSLIQSIALSYVGLKALPKKYFSIDKFKQPYTFYIELNQLADDNSSTKLELNKWKQKYAYLFNESFTSQNEKELFGEYGIPLFVYGYPGMLGDRFINSLNINGKYYYAPLPRITDKDYTPHMGYTQNSRYDEIYVSKQKFDELISKDDIFCLNIYGEYRDAFSKKLINNILSEGKCAYKVGGIRDFKNLKKIYPSTQSIIILPEEIKSEIRLISKSKSLGDVVCYNIRNLKNILNEIRIHDPDAFLLFSDNDNLTPAVHLTEKYIDLSRYHISNCNKKIKEYKKEINIAIRDQALLDEISQSDQFIF